MSEFTVPDPPGDSFSLLWAPVLFVVAMLAAGAAVACFRGTTEIAVPKKDIPAYTQITPEHVEKRAVTRGSDGAEGSADPVGHVTREALEAGEPISTDSITPAPVELADFGGLTLKLPPSRTSGVSVKPGDVVTVTLAPTTGDPEVKSVQVPALILQAAETDATTTYVVRLKSVTDGARTLDALGRSEVALVPGG